MNVLDCETAALVDLIKALAEHGGIPLRGKDRGRYGGTIYLVMDRGWPVQVAGNRSRIHPMDYPGKYRPGTRESADDVAMSLVILAKDMEGLRREHPYNGYWVRM